MWIFGKILQGYVLVNCSDLWIYFAGYSEKDMDTYIKYELPFPQVSGTLTKYYKKYINLGFFFYEFCFLVIF